MLLAHFTLHFWVSQHVCVHVQLLQLCPTFCSHTDCSRPPGTPVRGILQARTLEWATIAFSERHRLAGDKLLTEKVKHGCIGEGMGVQSEDLQEYRVTKGLLKIEAPHNPLCATQ